jgi:hypothetical protein
LPPISLSCRTTSGWLLVWFGRAVDNSTRKGRMARPQTENGLVATRL